MSSPGGQPDHSPHLARIGTIVRERRHAIGLSLSALSRQTDISKAYLSVIENHHSPNPPGLEILRSLEQALLLPPESLVTLAQFQKIPKSFQAVLRQLANIAPDNQTEPAPRSLDAAYLSGLLQRAIDLSAGNVNAVRTSRVPVINKVAAGYPSDFTDLAYPRGIADDYIAAPDTGDPDAFAARVFGDSMQPKYLPGDIVVFSPVAAVRTGDDCFVRFDDGSTTFKRVHLLEDQQLVRLVPRNPLYPTVDHPAERVAGVYRAVYSVRTIEND